ncbi:MULTISPECIES: DUF6677 family protein [unclassified Duganella]|uniref:DUF6677 family protein n=1 Tax=unclassified Duganella TaxID=2636909 RepID=UPI000E34F40B|nr:MULTISPECIES: DUF6677 family protein [unclassified Duganella]RFP19042.1 hypothetical protein D0T23_04460 [Duganella sp. BJB475]RFP35704.1 hypothetical protein D0T21_04460 [Duganella sp. BJB476]
MKASIKAALISALLFPGLGHLALRRGIRGLLFIVPTLLAAGYLLRATLALVDTLITELNSGKLPLDPLLILERVHSSGIDNPATNGAALVCFVCWIGSVADALWLGRHR